MADEESGLNQQAIGALLASGFPFQTTVAQIVRQATDWQVLAEEFPWRDESGIDHFLDLVGTKHFFVVTIEYKKTQKEVCQPTCSPTGSLNEPRVDHSPLAILII